MVSELRAEKQADAYPAQTHDLEDVGMLFRERITPVYAVGFSHLGYAAPVSSTVTLGPRGTFVMSPSKVRSHWT